jgi:hypothetical protein
MYDAVKIHTPNAQLIHTSRLIEGSGGSLRLVKPGGVTSVDASSWGTKSGGRIVSEGKIEKIEKMAQCFDSRPPECVKQFDRIEKKIDDLTRHMTGNRNPREGMIVRVDRLEQRSDSLKRSTTAIGAAVVTAFIGLIITVITFFFKDKAP